MHSSSSPSSQPSSMLSEARTEAFTTTRNERTGSDVETSWEWAMGASKGSVLFAARLSKSSMVDQIRRGQAEADRDLQLMLKWQRDGYVSVPGGHIGRQVEEDKGEQGPA